MHVIICIAILLLLVPQTSIASEWQHSIHDATALIKDKVIEWRHHFHANPELGNREFKTAEKVAEHLRALGFDSVDTGIAHTGVVGILKGGKRGAVVALRADMDALPVNARYACNQR